MSLIKSVKPEAVALGMVIAAIAVMLILFLASYATQGERPTFVTAHVINLDRDVKKRAAFERQASRCGLSVERWAATYGKDLHAETLYKQGIGTVIVIAGKGAYGKDQWKDLRNLGAVGCFLSHRSLLQHCATLPVSDWAGHLILEDDATLSDDFQAKWDTVRQTIPKDWDMIYLGVNWPTGDAVGADCLKLKDRGDTGNNTGTHGYIVRHGALRASVLPLLENMTDAIDQMYKRLFDRINVYATKTPLVETDADLESTIQTM